MAKLHLLTDTPEETRYVFFCPGCECGHWVRTRGPSPCWTWNGDVERPTFSPSLLSRRTSEHPRDFNCHAFVRDGRIEFLTDCDHLLSGQTVDLPEWDL